MTGSGAPEGTSCPLTACNDYVAICSGGVWRWQSENVCPVCASPDTPIATPDGERPIADIRVGDLVYSLDAQTVRPVRVARVGRRRADHHTVVRVTTAEGRVLEISAPHPTADGRNFGDLRAGGLLDGHRLQTVEVVTYRHEYTYDILPASSTGFYFAAGVLIGSTLDSRFGALLPAQADAVVTQVQTFHGGQSSGLSCDLREASFSESPRSDLSEHDDEQAVGRFVAKGTRRPRADVNVATEAGQ